MNLKECPYTAEVKRDDEMEDPEVKAKAEAGITFCKNATSHAASHDSKPWSYCLIPDSAISGNQSIKGLVAKYQL